MSPWRARRDPSSGFTLVEVLVALVVVALGLTALMAAVSGTARTSGYLRDKTIAQWIALNRLAQIRLTVNKLGDNGDAAEVDFANRKWHYDTRYFDTSFPSMKRVVVRVYAGDAKTKGNPIAESTGFLGASLGQPGMSNVDWTQGSTLATATNPCTTSGTVPGTPLGPTGTPSLNNGQPATQPCVNGSGTPAVNPTGIPTPNPTSTNPTGQTTP